MSRVKYEVCAVVGKRKVNGEEKPIWHKCGVIIETDKGLRLKLEAMPVFAPGSEGWFSLFEPKPKDEAPRQQTKSGGNDFDDDLGF